MESIRTILCTLVKDSLCFLQKTQASMKGKILQKNGWGDISTPADLEAQKHLTEQIERLFPGVPVFAEESISQEISDSTFIMIDPLDGSTNFYRGHTHFSNSIVWFDGGEPQVTASAVGELGEVFSACRGQGAYLNENIIKVNPTRLDDLSIIALHSYREGGAGLWDWLQSYRGKIRNYGSVVSHICQVACQRVDLCVFSNIKLWDFAGPVLVLMEAGGYVSDLTGAGIFPLTCANSLNSQQEYGIIASNGAAHLDLKI